MFPMLPELKSGQGRVLQPFSKPGWDYRAITEIRDLAVSLNVAQKDLGRILIDAVPDMWARILVFAFALNEQEHPLHSQAVGAFRGFLALLALRRRKNLNVDALSLAFEEGSDQLFLRTIQRLRPDTSNRRRGAPEEMPIEHMADDTGWGQMSVFTLNRQTIGVTSPLTLVCPAEGVHLHELTRLPAWWFDGFRFVDPTKSLGQETLAVADWVECLLRKLASHPAQFHGQWRNNLSRLMGEFQGDLLARHPGHDLSVANPRMSAQRLPLTYGLYQHLRDGLEERPADVENSQIRLRPLRQLPDEAARRLPVLLIADRDLDRKWGVVPEQIEVARGYTLADIKTMPFGADPGRLGNIPLPDNVQWREPRDLFTEKLVIIKASKNAFPGAVSLGGQGEIAAQYEGSPIPPIRTELLSYVTAEYIQAHSYFKRGSSGIEFCIRLPLAFRELEISRVYDSGSIIQDSRVRVPVLEIWPNFRHEQWKAYFTFWDRLGEDVFYARPFVPGVEAQECAEMRTVHDKEREVTELSTAPDFLVCSLDERGGGPGSGSREIGVLIPNLPQISRAEDLEFHVGVDFGTTNTNVYVRKEKDAPRPLELRTVTHQVTSVAEEVRDGRLYRRFVPPASKTKDDRDEWVSVPILSFFRRRVEAARAELAPIRDGHILFYHALYSHDQIGTGRVSTYLKWQSGQRAQLKAYLKQLCLHAAAEIVQQGGRSLHLSYSLPTAFPMFMVNDLEGIWLTIQTWLTEEVGVRCETPKRQTESVVAAKYFAARRDANPAVGSVFIDIGGGTSDISIWQRSDVLLQTSVRLSGRQIFLEPLLEMRDHILPLFPSDVIQADRLEELQNEAAEVNFFAKTDALLRTWGTELQKWLQTAPDNEHLDRFVDCVKLGLCGLFFYTGLMLRHVDESGRYERAVPSVHIAGNGCRLFHWVAKGIHHPNAQINRLFRQMLFKGANWNDDPGELRISVSRQPKAEAAYGLVVDYPLAAADVFDEGAFAAVVAGESFRVNGSASLPTTKLAREVVKAGIEVPNVDCLRTFVELYNSAAHDPDWKLQEITDEKRLLTQVHQEIIQWAQNQNLRQTRDIELEPLFIVGLKKLLSEFLKIRRA
jgi:hypothetical protein